MRRRKVAEVRVWSLAGRPLNLVHGIEGAWSCNGVRGEGPRLTCPTKAGVEYRLTAE